MLCVLCGRCRPGDELRTLPDCTRGAIRTLPYLPSLQEAEALLGPATMEASSCLAAAPGRMVTLSWPGALAHTQCAASAAVLAASLQQKRWFPSVGAAIAFLHTQCSARRSAAQRPLFKLSPKDTTRYGPSQVTMLFPTLFQKLASH